MDNKEKVLKLKLLCGKDCKIDLAQNLVFFQPPTLKEIINYDAYKFLKTTNVLFTDLDKFKKSLKDDDKFKEYSAFEIFLLLNKYSHSYF